MCKIVEEYLINKNKFQMEVDSGKVDPKSMSLADLIKADKGKPRNRNNAQNSSRGKGVRGKDKGRKVRYNDRDGGSRQRARKTGNMI
jgi:hypothetical protein